MDKLWCVLVVWGYLGIKYEPNRFLWKGDGLFRRLSCAHYRGNGVPGPGKEV